MQRRRGELILDETFWQRANTVLALIRAGYTTKKDLARRLGLPATTTWYVIKKMIKLGLVMETPGAKSTARLTEPARQMAPYIILAERNGNGAFVRIPPKRGGVC